MTSINVAEDDRLVCHHKPDCFKRSNSLATCTCDDGLLLYDSSEHSPLIAYQNYSEGADAKYLTDIHCHETKPMYSNARAKRKLVVASVVCLLFVIAEVIGGLLAGSLAIMTDAAHMLSDFASFLISLFAIWVARWLPDKRRTFGYYRAEVLGALVSVLIIWVLTGVLVYLAVQRVMTRDFNIDADIMLITAGVGLGVNILLGIILHQTGMGHNHSHGGGSHSHGASHSSHNGKVESVSTNRLTRSGSLSTEKQNINVRAAFIHVLGDIVQSVGVLIAAYIIKFKVKLTFIHACT
ncbi:zinc transporter 2-like [Orbicella faveolata]|uniref:zinc transporter 2-like n=1 Tax=Orbicella faveolata TaxID=48498 RepID=UPI0009E20213|nr:zinc transporter 2-like [Orbicella faveolata]